MIKQFFSWFSKKAYILLIFPPLFWGGNAVLGRGVVGVIPPITLAFWRWAVAFAITLPFAWPYIRQDWPVIRHNAGVLWGLAFLGIGCFNTLLYIGLQTTTAINGSLMQTAMPAVIILLSFAFFREAITGRQWVGVILCVLGAVVIIMRGDLANLTEMRLASGDVIILVAVVVYSLYSVLLRWRPPMHSLSFLNVTFAMGVVLLIPFWLWERSAAAPLQLNMPVILSFLYVGIFPSILAYLCWNQGIALVGSNTAGLYITLVPVFAAVLAVLFLGESVQRFHLTGLLIIAAGFMAFNRKRQLT